jgi:hypothetical protein
MKIAAALAALPATVFGIYAVTPAAPPPLVAKLVQTETIRPMQEASFLLRWEPVAGMPSMVAEPAAPEVVTPPRPVTRVLHPRPTNICTRHGMRKVTFKRRGYMVWRCRH